MDDALDCPMCSLLPEHMIMVIISCCMALLLHRGLFLLSYEKKSDFAEPTKHLGKLLNLIKWHQFFVSVASKESCKTKIHPHEVHRCWHVRRARTPTRPNSNVLSTLPLIIQIDSNAP
jgi:hypothetical protein